MNIGYLVCPNGFGHLRRSLSIVKELLLNTEFHITLFTQSKKLKKIIKYQFDNFNKLKIEDFYLPHPIYSNNTHYDSVVKSICKRLDPFDVVISDNLIYPLAYLDKDKMILISQFLWHEIHPNRILNKNETQIIDIEREFISNSNIPIFGVNMFTMPVIRKMPNYIPIHMIENPLLNSKEKTKSSNSILLTDGTTEASNHFISSFLPEINDFCLDKCLNLFVSPRLNLSQIRINDYKIFKYDSNSFSKIKIGICRPGLGIVSDLLSFSSVPLPLFNETNDELLYNSNVINDIFSIPHNSSLTFKLDYVLSNFEQLSDISTNIKFSEPIEIKNHLKSFY